MGIEKYEEFPPWTDTPKGRREIKRIIDDTKKVFDEKKRMLGVDADLEIDFLEHTPLEGINVYSKASYPKVGLDIFPLDATPSEIKKEICLQLVSIKHPELHEEDREFKRMVQSCIVE